MSHVLILQMAAAVLLLGGAGALVRGWRDRSRAMRSGVAPDPWTASNGEAAATDRPFSLVLPVLSIGAGAIHLAAFPEHLAELGALGYGFLFSGVYQLAWASGWTIRPGRLLAFAGVAGNAALIAAWLWSRTMGLPVGPDAGTPEAIGLADGLTVLFELALTVLLLNSAAIRGRLPRNALAGRNGAATAMLGVPILGLIILGTVVGSVAALDGHHDHDHDHDHEAQGMHMEESP